ncbi:MAG: hypothetical protein K2I36_02605 [Ureaplasma sp.]|nr:hypothetical protein [Ureaplasma sp.]
MKKAFNIVFAIISLILLVSSIVGASLGCPYALILLAPAILFSIKPIWYMISKLNINFKNK